MIKRCGILLLLAWGAITQTQAQVQTLYGIGYTAGQKQIGTGEAGVNYGVSTGAQTGATSGYKAIGPEGKILVQTGMPLGVGYFPQVFGEELFASKGYFSGYVQLTWKINAMGSRIKKFYIYRKPLGEEGDSTLVATVANDVYTWTDDLADNSVLYKYTVFAQGVSDNLRLPFVNYVESVGFVTATGTVSGRITFEGGTSVEGVNVVAYADGVQGNKSVYLNGTNASLTVYHKTTDKELELNTGFTVQAWCRYDGTTRGTLFSKGADYNVSYEPGTLKFTVGNTTASLPFTPESEKFFHVTAAFSPGKKIKLYVHHGEDKIDSVAVNAGTTPVANTDDIRIGRDPSGNFWNGYVDEIRLWNRALPYGEVKRDFNRYINGTETGIVGYWNLNAGIGDRFYDLSRKGNTFYKNDGYLLQAVWSNTSPSLTQLSYRGVTDAQGNYSIAGFPYATNGSMYTFTPMLGVHQFEPAQALRSVGNGAAIHNGVDFKDISSFKVSGTVRYRHSNFPVEGVSLLIDGKPVVTKEGTLVTTNNLGQFTIDVPIGLHNVRVSKNQHGFEFDGRFPKALPDGTLPQYDFQKAISGIDFIDTTVVKVAGRVAGGPVQEAVPIGFGRSRNNLGDAVIYITSEKGYDLTTGDSTKLSTDKYVKSSTTFKTKFVEVHPDPETGEFVTFLPPERYRVTGVTAGDYTFDASFHRTINLETVAREIQTVTDTLKAVQNSKPLPYPPYNADDYDSIWTVSKNGIVYTVGEIRFDLQSKQNFILRNTPSLSVKNINGTELFGETSFEYVDNKLGTTTEIPLIKDGTYAFGHPVFNQRREYKMVIDLFEEYTHAGTHVADRVPVVDGSIEIVNNLAVVTDKIVLPVNNNGRLVYTFVGGLPEINKDALNPAHSYTRTLSITAVSGNGGAVRTPWRDTDPFRGFVFGAMPVGNNFVTTGPNEIVSILRDPPGSGSFTTLEKGQATSKVTTWSETGSFNQEEQLDLKLGMTVETFQGLGVGVINTISTKVDIEQGIKATQVWGESGETTTTTEFTTSYSTSSNPEYVGAEGDVFIGYATNIVYGDALNVTPVPKSSCENCTPDGVQEFDGFKIGTEVSMRINPEFSTTFIYTQEYIEETLIPNLEKLRNNFLTYTGSPTLADPPADRAVYLSKIAPGTKGYGTNNTDSTTWGTMVVGHDQKHDGPSYKLYVPEALKSTFIDSIRYYNSQIAEWIHWLRYNEEVKINAKLAENVSFDAGSVYTKSKTSTFANYEERIFEFEVTESFAASKGFQFNSTGVDVTLGLGSTQAGYDNEGDGTTNYTTYGYTLSDANSGDYMSVDVKDGDGFSPIFKLRAGATKCPQEGLELTRYYIPGKGVLGEATLAREKASIVAQTAIVSNVPENRAAEFVLIMSNNSETNEDTWYTLTVDDTSNPYGAIIEIDGTPISNGTVSDSDGNPIVSGKSFFIPAGTSLQKTLKVRKGNSTTLDYPDLGLVLGSLCDAKVADTVKISAHFTPGCSDIAISAPQDKWVLNSNVQPEDILNVTIGNYDLNYGNFKQILFQYRASSTSQWTTERVFYNKKQVTATEYADAPEPKSWVEDARIQYPFDMHALPDRTYEIRAVAVCVLGPGVTAETPSEIMGGTKDTKRPVVFGTPQPGDGILQAGEDISIQFDEPIEASLLTPFNFSVKGALNNYQISDNTSITLDGDNDYVKVPDGLTLGKSFTVEFWLKRNLINREEVVFSKGNAPADAIQFGFSATNKMFVEFAGQRIESISSYTETNWHHYAITYDQTKKQINVYFDDTHAIFQASVTGSIPGHGPVYLGKSVNNDRFASVNVHGLRIWTEYQSISKVYAQSRAPLTGDEMNLAGCWPMDEAKGNKALDKARSRHALVFADWLVQPSGKSMQFGGADHVTFNTQSTVAISDEMDMTLELWFKGQPGQTNATLVSSGRADGTDLYNSGNMGVYVNASGKIAAVMNGEELIADDAGVLDNNWHHLALVLRRNANTTLYIDGVQKASRSSEHVGTLSTQFGLWIGARGHVASGDGYTPTFDQHFRGYIDELRVWKMARRVEQIEADAHARLQGNETGLIAYLPFERYETEMGVKVLRETLLDQWQNPSGPNAGAAVTNGAVFSDDVPNIKDARPLSNVDFIWAVNGDKIVITPTSALADIEKCVLEITVSDVEDRFQNRLASPVTWTAFIDKNPLKWDNDNLAFEKDLYAAKTFTVNVVNRGGTAHNYQIRNLPAWLKAQPSSGIMAPASSITVTFTIDPNLNTGYFSEDIFLTGDSDLGIEEKLHLELAVFAPAPKWSVDASKYQYSMNLIGQLKIEDIISTDAHDMVAAFVGNECRGVANLIYIEEFDRYEVFLDIFSNSEAGEEIELRVWDASKGAEYRNATPELTFLSNSLKGTPAMPVLIEAGANVARLFELEPGWNWVSFNLQGAGMSNINTLLTPLRPVTGDQIKSQRRVDVYNTDLGWTGTLSNTGGFTTGELYMMKIQQGGTFEVKGIPVSPTTPIAISSGWNWVGVNTQFNVSVNEALASLPSATGDVMKGKRAFAIYQSGLGWIGSLKYLIPHEGYMLQSASAGTLIYPEITSLSAGRTSEDAPEKEYWPVDDRAHAYNMTIVGRIEGKLMSETVVGAFNGNECLGFATPIQVDDEHSFYFLTLQGDGAETIAFKALNMKTNEVKPLMETVQFAPDKMIGEFSEPYRFTFGDAQIFQEETGNWGVSPNPFNDRLTVKFANALYDRVVTITDVMGRIVGRYHVPSGVLEKEFSGEISTLASGVYTLIIEGGGELRTVKLIKSSR